MTIMFFSLILSFVFLFLNHPMTMGLLLLLQTIIISLITGLLNSNFWFSYILFLIMIGGLLVLFIYMTSIASNEMFNYSNKMMLMMISMILFILVMNLLLDNYFINSYFLYSENIFFRNNNFSLSKYFNYPSIMIILLMITYLFITLIAIVKITKIEFGPLRQKF